jgi:hypothetical protein
MLYMWCSVPKSLKSHTGCSCMCRYNVVMISRVAVCPFHVGYFLFWECVHIEVSVSMTTWDLLCGCSWNLMLEIPMKTRAISVFIVTEQLNDHYTWSLLFLHTWVLKSILCAHGEHWHHCSVHAWFLYFWPLTQVRKIKFPLCSI